MVHHPPKIDLSFGAGDDPSAKVFGDLPQSALEILDRNKIVNSYKRGQFIYYAGNTASGLFFVHSGIVKIENEGHNGTGHILRVIQRGGMLGYQALFAEEPYNSSAVVHEDATICFIPKSALLDLLASYPHVGVRFLSIVSKELKSVEKRLCSLTDKNAGERVAEAVLFLLQKIPSQNWTRKEIAEWAGTTAETVIRTLGALETQGLIEQTGRRIVIIDKPGLMKAANL